MAQSQHLAKFDVKRVLFSVYPIFQPNHPLVGQNGSIHGQRLLPAFRFITLQVLGLPTCHKLLPTASGIAQNMCPTHKESAASSTHTHTHQNSACTPHNLHRLLSTSGHYDYENDCCFLCLKTRNNKCPCPKPLLEDDQAIARGPLSSHRKNAVPKFLHPPPSCSHLGEKEHQPPTLR